ncbi:DNAS1 protein, partial [Corythaeola cristata]|nr:DNAS1 protein [Corythaeola cristata]
FSKLVLSLLVAALLLHVATTLKISAFNIKTFGDSKMSNQTVADIIVSILSEYDITVVQEVRDTDLSAVNKLMDQLNSVSLHPYSFLDSIPLGRSSYKEQYIFIYRSDMVSVLGSYYYDDGCESCGTDTFSREPFIVKFSSPTTREQSQRWGLPGPGMESPPHRAEPGAAPARRGGCSLEPSSGAPLGSFTAVGPCPTRGACEWLIPDSADTTVTATTDCAYDRIVACGTALRQDIEPSSATVNNFQETFHLQSKDALAVSDHFPVEVTLKAH